MRIAIVSDIHDNLENLQKLLDDLKGVDILLCCGDLCSPFIVTRLGEGFHGPIHVVFGNNDGDLYRITRNAERFPQIELHGEFAEVEFRGKRFAMTHFPEIGEALACSAKYDAVCFGHNHEYKVERVGDTWSINPGEIMGGLTGKSTYVLYDTETDRIERRDL